MKASKHNLNFVEHVCAYHEISQLALAILATELDNKDKLIKKYKSQQKVALHKNLLVEHIGKLQRLLVRNDAMMTELMPGIAGLVINIGELNDLLISNRLMIDTPTPSLPVPSQRIFG